MSLPLPFPAGPHTDTLVGSGRLQELLEGLRKKYFHMGVAVADMTDRSLGGIGGLSSYAGWNLSVTRFSASLLKIAAMFGAFQLRENLKAAIVGLKAKDGGDLFRQVASAWRPLVARAVPGPENFPELGRTFDAVGAGGGWTVDFADAFREDLRLMASYSDVAASSRCINALGHQYINGALAAEELYLAKATAITPAGGMWVGGDYGKVVFRSEPVNATGSWLTGSPATFMRFLDLVDSRRLVSESASLEMRSLMLHSWMEFSFLKGRHLAAGTFGKLGYDYVKKVRVDFDCGVFVRPRDRGATVRYALVMLGGSFLELKELGLAIDDIMTTAWRSP